MLLFELTPDLETHAFALNEWDDPTFEGLEREDYAYAATPEVAALDDAHDAYQAGDDAAAARLAKAAVDQRDAATDRGRMRAALVGGGILIGDLLAMAGLAFRDWRRRLRQRSEVTAA